MTAKELNFSLLARCVLVLALLSALTASAEQTSDPFYIVAHMANNQQSIQWAVSQGANAIENDIQFDGGGRPYLFEHGGLCDCSCLYPRSYHICDGALERSCTASDGAANHLRKLAKSGIALIFIDSKVDAKWGTRLQTAGTNIVNLLEENLFKYGYGGKVIISAAKINCYDYVYAAAKAAARTSNKDKYYFTFDQENKNYNNVVSMLSRFTKNRAFGTGTSACLLGSYHSVISKAASGVRRGEIGLSYIWTLNLKSSMESYIDQGVHAIITNRPGLLKQVALSRGLRLAKPEDNIPEATTDLTQPNKCDCNYHRGGCTISFPAPIGKACKCSYKGFWTCGGYVVNCSDSDPKCSNPDGSKEACRLGGGDCGGY